MFVPTQYTLPYSCKITLVFNEVPKRYLTDVQIINYNFTDTLCKCKHKIIAQLELFEEKQKETRQLQ